MRGEGVRTEKVSLSISKETSARLTSYCDERLVNKSRLVSRLIREFLDRTESGQKKQFENGIPEPAEGKQEERA